MNELEELERELGPSLRESLRGAAATITDQRESVDPSDPVDKRWNGHAQANVAELPTARVGRPRRRRWLITAGAAAVGLVLAGAVLTRGPGGDRTTVTVAPVVRESTVPAPSTTAAPRVSSTAAGFIVPTFDADGTAKAATPTAPVAAAPSISTVPPPSTTAAPAPPTTATSTAGASIVLPGFSADVAPAAATPSTPAVGELVAAVSRIHAGAWYLYADGRLVSIDDGYPARGWVEQRLTVEGVERVRAKFLASGLFDPNRPPGGIADGRPSPTVQVRDGGQLLTARPLEREAQCCPAFDVYPEIDRLVSYFREGDSFLGEDISSLPDDMWVDRQVKKYVSSRYEFCVARMSRTSTHDALPDPSIAVTLLPPGPAAMLAGRPTLPQRWTGGSASCFEVTRDEAQSLADELSRVGTIQVTTAEPMTLSFSIAPLLPHGTPAMWGG